MNRHRKPPQTEQATAKAGQAGSLPREKKIEKYNIHFNCGSFCLLSFYPVPNFRKIYTGQVFRSWIFSYITSKSIPFRIIVELMSMTYIILAFKFTNLRAGSMRAGSIDILFHF